MKSISLCLKNVTLDYPIYGLSTQLLTKRILSLATAGKIETNQKYQFVRALDDISVTLEPEDRLAIIGGNGAGKTTLLKVLAGIFHPTSGVRKIKGKITCILGSGFGLDDDSTGYENIILGGVALGHSIKQMRSKIADIESFTELGNFLNLPLRTYSAGMKARLAFAISTSVFPDILIIDEGLGAGDQSFFEKAQQRFDHFFSYTKILVFASHSADLLEKFCNKSIVMHHGKIVFSGTVQAGLDYYSKEICHTQA